MRCKACDTELTDFEATRKIVNKDGTIEYPDLCDSNGCFDASGIANQMVTVERKDLIGKEGN